MASGAREAGAEHALRRPAHRLPLIRHLSYHATRALLPLPVTPNQITWASMLLGLGAAGCLALGATAYDVLGAGLLIAAYVLDNSDGEIARCKRLQSEFGRRLDDVADWVVHAALFVGMGYGAARAGGHEAWLWLGWIAAAGATINYGLSLRPRPEASQEPATPEAAPRPQGPRDWLVFVFRELFRADFCFILLALALADMVWLLLPAAAIGAQVYWAAALVESARRFHV